MMTLQEKQIRKEVRKQLFDNMDNAQFQGLRRMYYACLWLQRGGVSKNHLTDSYSVLQMFEEGVLAKYRELNKYIETIEWKCCKDLYCMDFMTKAEAPLRLYWSVELRVYDRNFINILNKYENKILKKIEFGWDYYNQLTDGECCFILFLHPELNPDKVLEMAFADTLTVSMKQAREQGKKDKENQRRQERNGTYNYEKPPKYGKKIIIDPTNLNWCLMRDRKIR